MNHQKILITPLNWGWGHAARCVPIIQKIIDLGYEPVIASDGDALNFLRKEFPSLSYVELPSYNIWYHRFFKLGILAQLPKIGFAILKEYLAIQKIIKNDKNIIAIINDNRLGVFHSKIKSVYITHQLNIQAGIFSWGVNKIHHFFIRKHQQCWVPDNDLRTLSGNLSLCKGIKPIYIGWLSRFSNNEVKEKKYDLLVLLSGIASQRNRFEKMLIRQLQNYQGRVLWVRGVFTADKLDIPDNFTQVDALFGEDLKKAIRRSKMVLCRSGYSTLMDLAVLQSSAIVIPTPGQSEQEYLAKHLEQTNQAITSDQFSFRIKKIETPLKKFKEVESNVLEKTLKAFLEH